MSALLAQLLMEDLEKTVLKNRENEIPFFKRSVDDCLTSIPEALITPILNEIYNYHPKLKFTTEIENSNKIDFLDMTFIQNNLK